jgi:CheY-like chemotaxis protein/HPt (histidine-containing phosphotransfer) domain-containing protein
MDAVLQDFLHQQGYALCEYLGKGEFSLLAPPPAWFSGIWKLPSAPGKSLHLAKQSPFLKRFLLEAEAFWDSQAPGVLPSGVWMERASDRREVPLEAFALRVSGKRVLSLQTAAADFDEQTRILQSARDGITPKGAAVAERTRGDLPPSLLPASPAPLRILLAEDDPAIRELTELLLSRQGHKVVAVSNGKDALRILASRHFDVVLLDDEMPGLGGAQTAQHIRAREKPGGKHQFILSLSGNNTEADKRRLLEAGVDACLGKPFHADELYRALARLANSPAAAAPESSRNTGAPPVDPALLARVGGDRKLLQGMIKTFLKDFPKKIALIRSAAKRQDVAALTSAAHALKGAVSIFGADQAMDLAQQLRDLAIEGRFAAAAQTFQRLEEEIAKLENKLRGYTADVRQASSVSGTGKARVRKSHKRRRR